MNEGRDRILKFNINQDLIDLSAIFSNAAFAGESDFQRFRQYVDLIERNGSTEIQVDSDGNGEGGNMVTLAIVKRLTGMTSENFIVS